MKKVLIAIIGILIIVVALFGIDINKTENNQTEDILRIHIRANSNESIDQEIKYKVKDKIVDYLIPKLKNVENKKDVENVVNNEKNNIISLTNKYLSDNGFEYVCNIKIQNEEFPTRSYNSVVFESGYYDAVIVELGKAEGNNWWCVIYPPLCFTKYSNGSAKNIVYKSKIMEIINKMLKRS